MRANWVGGDISRYIGDGGRRGRSERRPYAEAATAATEVKNGGWQPFAVLRINLRHEARLPGLLWGGESEFAIFYFVSGWEIFLVRFRWLGAKFDWISVSGRAHCEERKNRRPRWGSRAGTPTAGVAGAASEAPLRGKGNGSGKGNGEGERQKRRLAAGATGCLVICTRALNFTELEALTFPLLSRRLWVRIAILANQKFGA